MKTFESMYVNYEDGSRTEIIVSVSDNVNKDPYDIALSEAGKEMVEFKAKGYSY